MFGGYISERTHQNRLLSSLGIIAQPVCNHGWGEHKRSVHGPGPDQYVCDHKESQNTLFLIKGGAPLSPAGCSLAHLGVGRGQEWVGQGVDPPIRAHKEGGVRMEHYTTPPSNTTANQNTGILSDRNTGQSGSKTLHVTKSFTRSKENNPSLLVY